MSLDWLIILIFPLAIDIY